MAKFEMPKFEMPTFEMPKFEMPTFDMPTFEMPSFEMPKVELPEVDLPSIEQITGLARDAAYVGVGLAVMTAERIQALQDQLLEILKDQLARVRPAA